MASPAPGPDSPPTSWPAAKRLRIGELFIDVLTFDEAIAAIERLVDAGQGGAVFTPNVDHVVQVERDAAFRAAYARVSLSLVDGQPLVWASHLLGQPLPQKISGSDLIQPLMRTAERRHYRVYLLGGQPGVAELAAEKLRAQFAIEIAGIDAPRVSASGQADDEPAMVARIQRAAPHLVLAAFGAPKQELLIDRVRTAIRPAVAIGVGAGFDFVAGRVRRAPPWMSEHGLEWLFRLAQEPRRLARRYLLDDPRFAAILYRTQRRQRRGEGRDGAPPDR